MSRHCYTKPETMGYDDVSIMLSEILEKFGSRSGFGTKDKWESSVVNANKGDFDTILMEILEQRTGSQGWFSTKVKWSNYLTGRAGHVWWSINRTPELRALRTVMAAAVTQPDFTDCGFDDQTKRALTALFHTLEAEKWERGSCYHMARADRTKAQKALNGTTEQKCSCGNTHEHSEKPSVTLPTPVEMRMLVEQAVDKHLVNSLLAN